MRKISILLSILFWTIISGQSPTKFEFSANAMNAVIVIDIPSKNASEIYSRSIEWIKKNYNSPNDVIITTVEDDYIRFQGVAKNLVKTKSLGLIDANDLRYTAEISFKNEKYKFELIKIEEEKDNFGDHIDKIASSATNRNVTVRKLWEDTTKYWLNSPEIERFKKNGSGFIKKDGTIRNVWKDYIHLVPEHFNELNFDLKSYIEGVSSQSKKEW